jgi:type 1 glutamine amidotransferase
MRKSLEKTLLAKLAACLGGIILVANVTTVSAGESPALDCPLRDAPFSLDLPLMDIMLSPAAVEIVNRHMDGVLNRLPPTFASTEAPSFSAILTLKEIVGMTGMPREVLEPIAGELAQLTVTDADRAARCERYDTEIPAVEVPQGKPRILVFEKMTGFRDGPSVEAASAALTAMAERNGWAMVTTELGGAMTPAFLQQFDAVIWNNVSGDVLTLTQRKAFEDYINGGGGYVGIHGSAGDFIYFWNWYVDTLIGARFIGHPMEPQFQDARINVETNITGIGESLAPDWVLNDEWYSFRQSPRDTGATVIATLDETTYSPVGRGGQNVRMGDDHPIAWSRCIGEGRSFYSAIGHRPEVYGDARHLQLLEQGILWSAGKENSACTAYNQEGK